MTQSIQSLTSTWDSSIAEEGAIRGPSVPAESTESCLEDFTVECLVLDGPPVDSSQQRFRSRLIRDATDTVVYDAGKLRTFDADSKLLYAAIDLQFEIELTRNPT